MVNVILDGGGAVLTTGLKAAFEIPFPCDITKAAMEVTDGTTGSVTLDIRRITEAQRISGYAQSSADSIAGAKLVMTSAARLVDYALNGWDVRLAPEDWLYINVDSATTVTRLTLSLTLRRLLA